MRKRLLSLALTAGMALTLLPASALAAEPGNVTWLDESIVSYDGLGYYNNAGDGFTAEGLAVVENDEGLYGYINQYGEIAIPCQYQAARAFQEGVAAVQNQEGWWGYIDTQGDVFLPFEYGGATPFDGGYAVANGRLIDKAGNIISTPGRNGEYLGIIGNFILGRPSMDDLYCIYDLNGNQIGNSYPPEFAEVFLTDDLVAIPNVESDSKTGFTIYDKNSNLVRTVDYISLKPFSEGLAPVAIQDPATDEYGAYLWGFVNEDWELVIPCQYKWTAGFQEGLARVSTTDSTGVAGSVSYIDKKGDMVIEYGGPAHGNVNSTSQYAVTAFAGEYFSQGLTPYLEAHEHSDGYGMVFFDYTVGYMDQTGTGVIEADFADATDFVGGVALVTTPDERIGVLRHPTEPITPPSTTDPEPPEGPEIEVSEATVEAAISEELFLDENIRDLIGSSLDKASVTGVDEALTEDGLDGILEAAIDEVGSGSQVTVQIQVVLLVTAADLEAGTISFTAEPHALVTIDGRETVVPVLNSYLDGSAITVKLPVPAGFVPAEVLHISQGYPIEQYLADDGFRVEDGAAVLEITHFSELCMSETPTTVAKIDGSGAGYFSLQSAIDASESEDVISLYQNSKDTVLQVVRKDLTIRCNTYTVRDDAEWRLIGCTKSETQDDAGNPVLVISRTSSGGGSSSGGGGGSASSYMVNVSSAEHGTVTASPSRAAQGATVTVTVRPDGGYELDRITVTDQNGDKIGVTQVSGTRYTFEMPRGRVSVEAVFAPADTEAPDSSGLPFADVAESAWYYDAVAYCYENGLMSGVSATSFRPMDTTTRGMIVTILHQLAGKPVPAASASFPDVAADAWYADAVSWAAAQGVVAGYDTGRFGPNDSITREQLAVILYRYAGSPAAAGSLDSFADRASVSDYAAQALRWAVGEGLLSGKGAGLLYPTGTATRAEAAQILMRFCEQVTA